MLPSVSKSNHFANSRNGFSLISVILVLALLLILITGLAAYLRVETAASAGGLRQVQAEQYAKLGLRSALLALQTDAGPDQRATAVSNIMPNCADRNRYWTGVWDSPTGDFLQWLVSCSDAEGNPTPLTALEAPEQADVFEESPRTVRLLDTGSVAENETVTAGVVSAPAADGPYSGEFAWWVGDEGVKAKFLPVDPWDGTEDAWKRLSASPRVAVESMSGGAAIGELEGDQFQHLTTMEQLPYLQSGMEDFVQDRFHDLTTYSHGVLSDTRNGGLRRDLTHAFENDAVFEREFEQSDQIFYFLEDDEFHDWLQSTSFSSPGSNYTGPNWGNLRSYYQLKEDFSPGDALNFTAHPPGRRMEQHEPYVSTTSTHSYTTNSPVFPVQSRIQLTIGVEFEKLSETTTDGVIEERFAPVLRIYPLVVISNPYNVRLTSAGRHVTRWTLNPLIHFQVGTNPLVDFNLYETFVLQPRDTGGFDPVRPEARTRDVFTLDPGESLIFGLEAMGSLSESAVAEDGEPTTAFMRKVNDVNARGYYRLPLVSPHIHRASTRGASDQHSAHQIATTPRFGLTQEEMDDLIVVRRTDEATGLLISQDEVDIGILFGKFTMSWHNQISPNSGLQRYDGLMGGFNDPTLTMDNDGSFFFNVPLEGDHKLATWRFGFRSTMETDHPARWIDGNFRPIYIQPRYEARVQGLKQGVGSNVEGALIVSGYGNPRGVFPGNVWEMPGTADGKYRAFWGPGISGSTGASNPNADDQTNVILFDVPRYPLLSLGQLQHANIGHYSFHALYPISNSYAPPLLGRNEAWRRLQPAAVFPVIDHSYNINNTLWDSYFFSAIPQDGLDQNTIEALFRGEEQLPNSRLRLYRPAGLRVTPESLSEPADPLVFATAAGQLLIDGPFNVNSTSEEAWRAILGGLNDMEVPHRNAVAPEFSEVSSSGDGIAISRFSMPFGDDENYWTGFRRISQTQIDRLAEEIVRQVRLRGPFLTLGQFVNRKLSNDLELSASGALQSALDNVPEINSTSDIVSGAAPLESYGDLFAPTPPGPQSTGAPGHILQADILQTIGPILTVRSDTFRIRAYGAVRNDVTGRILAEAWCEAIVQRLPDPVGEYQTVAAYRQALAQPPQSEGRKFRIVGFRWLSPDEV